MVMLAAPDGPLALGADDLRAPFFDAVSILARAAIVEAGGLVT